MFKFKWNGQMMEVDNINLSRGIVTINKEEYQYEILNHDKPYQTCAMDEIMPLFMLRKNGTHNIRFDMNEFNFDICEGKELSKRSYLNRLEDRDVAAVKHNKKMSKIYTIYRNIDPKIEYYIPLKKYYEYKANIRSEYLDILISRLLTFRYLMKVYPNTESNIYVRKMTNQTLPHVVTHKIQSLDSNNVEVTPIMIDTWFRGKTLYDVALEMMSTNEEEKNQRMFEISSQIERICTQVNKESIDISNTFNMNFSKFIAGHS